MATRERKGSPRHKRRKTVHNDIIELHARMSKGLGVQRDIIIKEERELAKQFTSWTADRDEFEKFLVNSPTNTRIIHETRASLVSRRVNIIKKVADVRASTADQDLTTYLLDAIPFLNVHHAIKADLIALKAAATGTQAANSAMSNLKRGIHINANAYAKKFFPEFNLVHDAPPPNLRDNLFFCDSCKTSTIIETETAHLTCTTCGQTVIGVSFNKAKNLTWEQLRQLPGRQYTYKRLNHFREYLRQTQGKSHATVPDEVVDELRSEFTRHRVRTEDITPIKVKKKLAKINQTKYYEQRESLAFQLNSTYELLDIDPVHEEKLCLMFVQLEAPFEKIKHLVDKKRKNFMSYPFTYFKLNELNGWDAYNRNCCLLKSVQLINKQDHWWKLVMGELGWEYVGRTFDVHRRP